MKLHLDALCYPVVNQKTYSFYKLQYVCIEKKFYLPHRLFQRFNKHEGFNYSLNPSKLTPL